MPVLGGAADRGDEGAERCDLPARPGWVAVCLRHPDLDAVEDWAGEVDAEGGPARQRRVKTRDREVAADAAVGEVAADKFGCAVVADGELVQGNRAEQEREAEAEPGREDDGQLGGGGERQQSLSRRYTGGGGDEVVDDLGGEEVVQLVGVE